MGLTRLGCSPTALQAAADCGACLNSGPVKNANFFASSHFFRYFLSLFLCSLGIEGYGSVVSRYAKTAFNALNAKKKREEKERKEKITKIGNSRDPEKIQGV